MYEPVRRALLPGVLGGILCVLMIASLAAVPPQALAATLEAQISAPAAQEQPAAEPPPVVEVEQESVSPFDWLVRVLAPLIFNHPAAVEAAPVAETQQDQAEEPETAPSDGGGCAIGGGFSENVRRWCDLISRAAADQGVEADILAAVMTVESGGDPDAYSHNGAVGLMQVMPRDGIAASFVCANGPCFARRPSMAELYDPEYNLQYAAGMLAGLYNRHGSWRDALFAYGPAGVGYSYADKVLGVYERSR
jgi:soluble lytic murein transglycosylase-like protein